MKIVEMQGVVEVVEVGRGLIGVVPAQERFPATISSMSTCSYVPNIVTFEMSRSTTVDVCADVGSTVRKRIAHACLRVFMTPKGACKIG